MRITNNMIQTRVLANLQANFSSVSRLQDVLSTGRQFRFPEDNPINFVNALSLRQELNENRRYSRNIDQAETNLQLTESTLSVINDRLQRARELALQGSNETLPPESQASIADEIDQIFEDVIELANANFDGRYLFAGDRTQTRPFQIIATEEGIEGVHYRGDFGDRPIEIGQGEYLQTNLTGPEAFFTKLNEITSSVAVDPNALLEPQLTGVVDPPLNLAAGNFTVNGVTVNFDPATDSLTDIRDAINRSVDTADARIDENGRLIIRSLTSQDVELANGTSNVLEALDLFHRIEGGDLGGGPLTPATTLASLGITGDAIVIDTGDQEYEIDLAGATDLAGVIAAVAASGAPVEAFINGAGNGLTFSATESVNSLEIRSLRKIFGSTALAPGTVNSGTTLASLGIASPGILEISNDGVVTQVDLTGAVSVEQVVDAINSQVNGVTATINADGTGIDLESAFLSSSLSANDVGPSTIAASLGFAQTRAEDNASDFQVTSPGSVDEVVGSNLFRNLALLSQELRSGNADPDSIGVFLNAFEGDLQLVLRNRSIVGSRINRLDSSRDRFDAFEVFVTELLSENEDADLAETISTLATQNNILEASLASASRVLLPSLIDFLA
ncbi:MAG: flagellar hook-associated protein FlgL [Candidatus Omnitrophica bacterium]|nr:flagellar hook-associated protein FlgL [Candidatus Omnitrophota bacterium]